MTHSMVVTAFFDDYAGVARVASAAFMIIQIIIILDYACASTKSIVCCYVHHND